MTSYFKGPKTQRKENLRKSLTSNFAIGMNLRCTCRCNCRKIDEKQATIDDEKIHLYDRKSLSAFFPVKSNTLSFLILLTKGPVQLFQQKKVAGLVYSSWLTMSATKR